MTPSQPQLPARYGSPTFLAEGAFGRVYRAELPEGPVAVKILAPQWLGDPEAIWAFGAEARRLAGLAHPAFPALVDQGVAADGSPYFAMAYLPGAPPAGGTAAEVRQVLAAVAGALTYLHQRELVHGDLKAENVLVDAGRVSVLDVGMAHPFGERRTAVDGTLEYAAPEVLRLAAVAPEADWYAFAVLGYALLTGAPPFAEDGRGAGDLVRRHLLEAPAPLPPAVQAADPALAAAVMALLAKDPLERSLAVPPMLALLGVAAAPSDKGLAPGRWQPLPALDAAWAALALPGARIGLAGPQGAGKSHAMDAFRLEASLAGGTWLGASGRDRKSVV